MIERLVWFVIGVYFGFRLGSPVLMVVDPNASESEDVPAETPVRDGWWL